MKYFEEVVQKNKKFISLRRLLSFNCRISAIIGARGRGKTNSITIKYFDDFINKGKKFIWLRNNEESFKKLVSNNCRKFLNPIRHNPRFKGWLKGKRFVFSQGLLSVYYTENIDNKKEKIVKDIGYFIPCSTFYSEKGSTYETINNICYDEFIREKSEVQRGSRVLEFVNTIETISRLNDKSRLLMTANALDKGDEILDILGFKNIDKYGYYLNREKSSILYYCESSEEFKKAKEKSLSGLILKGTEFEENIVENKFIENEVMKFDTLPSQSILLWILMNDNFERVRIYIPKDDNDKYMYVKEDNNRETQPNSRYVINKDLVGGNYRYIEKERLNKLKEYYNKNLIKYQFLKYKKIIFDFIK